MSTTLTACLLHVTSRIRKEKEFTFGRREPYQFHLMLIKSRLQTMAETAMTSLSADGPKPPGLHPHSVKDYPGLDHPPHLDRLHNIVSYHARVEPVSIDVNDGADGSVSGLLHLPHDLVSIVPATHHRTATILLSGAGGGVNGPSSIYLSLACKVATIGSGVPAVRLDYRYPARTKYCVDDVKATMAYLEKQYGLTRFVLVGWSFGGAPVYTVGGSDHRVVGCATVASQTADTEGIRSLAPTPVLLLHGKDDRTLSYKCSERRHDQYGEKGRRELRLFEGDNHALSWNAANVEALLCDFIERCAAGPIDEHQRNDVVGQDLIDEEERKELMEKGGDLRGGEHIE